MWDETLKKIDYSGTPARAAALWDAAPDSLQLISNGINLVYRFESKGKGYYLRITHPQIRSYAELVSALDYQRYLFENGAPVCSSVYSSNGNYIEQIIQDDLLFYAHVATEVPGKMMTWDHSESYVCKTWGKAVAQLHVVAQTYVSSKELQFKSWKGIWENTADYLAHEEDIVIKEYETVEQWFKTMRASFDNFGLTHGDHRTANVLYDGKEISIIDFDEPVYHWFLADIARPFLELGQKPYTQWKQKFRWFIEGYYSIKKITNEELSTISWFARMKTLDLYLWVKNNWHNPTGPSQSRESWLAELKQMILQPLFTISEFF